MKRQEREIPKKNYLYLIIMFIIVIFVTLLIFDIRDNINSKKLETSNFNQFISEVKLEEIDSILTEPSSDLFILITKVNDEEIYQLEGNIKRIIKNYDMRENFIYIDYTDKEISELNKKLNTNIKTIPALIYYKNGVFVKSVDSSEDLLNSSDIEQIIEEFELN